MSNSGSTATDVLCQGFVRRRPAVKDTAGRKDSQHTCSTTDEQESASIVQPACDQYQHLRVQTDYHHYSKDTESVWPVQAIDQGFYWLLYNGGQPIIGLADIISVNILHFYQNCCLNPSHP